MTINERQANDVVDNLGRQYPIYTDEDWSLFHAFETGYFAGPPLPAWVVVDAKGVVRYVWRARDGNSTEYVEADDIVARLRELPGR
jgi:hypothetical protein